MGNKNTNNIVLVGLDRDGTINYDPGYFGREDNWREQLKLYDGVPEGIRRLNADCRIKVVVATNQAGPARGFYTPERSVEVNKAIDDVLRNNGAYVDRWYSCHFVSMKYAQEKGLTLDNPWVNENTDLRKPGMGMLKQATRDLGYNLNDILVYFIGDKASDVQTGLNAGGKGVLVLNGVNGKEYQKVQVLVPQYPQRIVVVQNLLEAAQFVLAERSDERTQ